MNDKKTITDGYEYLKEYLCYPDSPTLYGFTEQELKTLHCILRGKLIDKKESLKSEGAKDRADFAPNSYELEITEYYHYIDIFKKIGQAVKEITGSKEAWGYWEE